MTSPPTTEGRPELAATIARLEAIAPRPGATISPLALRIDMDLGAAGPNATVPKVQHSLPRLEIAARGASARADLELLGPLGEGGMGRVDLAVQRSFGRVVAMKRVRADRMCVSSVEALLHEATIVGSLEHPNVVPAHLVGKSESGEPVLVMKRVEGVPWSTLIESPEHPAWRDHAQDRLGRHLEILIDVCHAVEFAHRAGVVHCDLKPANVMVGDLGEVFVLDWGVAVRLSDERSSDIAGTPAYMAPEMLQGSVSVSSRTDVYLLGAILHEVLTGRPPHVGTSFPAVVGSIADSEPVTFSSEVPVELGAIRNRAMARDPAERFESALALRDALRAHLRHRSSMELVREGEASLTALDRALASSTATDEERAHVRRLATEAEFAFRQALREWVGNALAEELRQACGERMVGFEIAQRNAPGARARLAELTSPPEGLDDRVRALEQELAEEARAKTELTRSREDRDFGISTQTRILVVVVLYTVLGAIAFSLHAMEFRVTTDVLFGLFTTLYVGFGGLVFWRRRELFVNEANRTQQRAIALMATSGWLSVLVCWLIEFPPAATLAIFMGIGVVQGGQLALWTEPSNFLYVVGIAPALGILARWPDRPLLALGSLAMGALLAAFGRLALHRRAVRDANVP